MSMEQLPEIQVDWNDGYGENGIGLDGNSAQMSIREGGIILKEGLRVRLYGDQMEAEAIIRPFELNGHAFLIAEIVEGTLREVPLDPLKPWGGGLGK